MVGLTSTYINNTWDSCHMRVQQADVAAEAGRRHIASKLLATCRSEPVGDESNAFCATWRGGARVYRDFRGCTRSTVQCVCHELQMDRGRQASPVRHGYTNACRPKEYLGHTA